MKLKKALAGVMAAAMTATMLPGSMFAVPETAEAKTETSGLPEAKYEMDFENDLTVNGPEGVSVSTLVKGLGAYTGNAVFIEGRDGKVLDTQGAYGLRLENVDVDSTYTISAWVNLQSAAWPNPIISASNSTVLDNWMTMAGTNDGQYMLWCDSNRAPGGDNVELGRTNYTLNEWVEYTLSVNGETAVLYENGTEAISGTNYGVVVDSALKNIAFGVNYWDDTPDVMYDDIKIYDEALTAGQVQALYAGATVELSSSVPSGDIRIGDTTEITANIIGGQAGDTVEWSSNSECVSVNDGVITAVSEGTATITANVMRNGNIIATGTIDINVLPEKGSLIAEFTFDEEASEFYGAGAVAKKANPDDTNYASVVNDETKGSVLRLNNTGNAAVGNWLEVTKEDGSSLLSGVKEFTVSYDSSNNGLFQNSWTFFADQPGVKADARQYIAIIERTDDDANSLQVERHGANTGAGATVDNAWKHVDVVFGENSTEIYVDGVLRASVSSDYSVEECLGEDSFIHIGHATWPVSEGGENLGREYWNGMLDNYKIYNYALTAEEIASTPVSNIEVTADSSTMYAGETLQLDISVAPDNATDKSVEWTTSDPEVATVDENGLVTAKAAGDVTITATAQDKDGKSGSIDLTVKAALTYHEAKDPTCTEPGNIEYWTDAEGNYYSDAAGTIPTTADKVKVDATGHSYGQPTWEWMKSEDGSTYTAATATFICEKGDDTQQVTDEEVSHVIENGQVTYSAEVTFGEQSYETTTTADLVLTATEEAPATCTEAGTKAYWTDQFGNLYLDAEGQSPVTDDEELVIPATGHDYISSGRWIATEDGYSLDVTFTCKHGDDTATVPANVTSSTSEGVTVYTAVAEYNGTQFTYTKEVQDSYTLTVVDGTIEGTEVTTNNYGYNDVVTVVAEEMKDGQYFEGWYIGDTLVSGNPVYSFCIVEDKTLTARYSSEETEERAVVSLRMSDRENIGSGAERVVMTVEWSVPSDYTMVGAGLVRSYTESSEDMLTLEHVDGSSIRQNSTTAWCRNGSYKATLNMSPTTKLNPVNARGYLIYEDEAGEEHTIYTDVYVSPVTQ